MRGGECEGDGVMLGSCGLLCSFSDCVYLCSVSGYNSNKLKFSLDFKGEEVVL